MKLKCYRCSGMFEYDYVKPTTKRPRLKSGDTFEIINDKVKCKCGNVINIPRMK